MLESFNWETLAAIVGAVMLSANVITNTTSTPDGNTFVGRLYVFIDTLAGNLSDRSKERFDEDSDLEYHRGFLAGYSEAYDELEEEEDEEEWEEGDEEQVWDEDGIEDDEKVLDEVIPD